MAVSWLGRYGTMIAKHRLSRLVRNELEDEHRPLLGLMLDLVREESKTKHFNDVIELCRESVADRADQPLFDIYRNRTGVLARLRRRATAVSRQWGLLGEPIEIKTDALRSPAWIIRMNPSLRTRADLGGDLRCSILQTLADEPEAGASEMALARACEVTRRAIRLALTQLELAGRVVRSIKGRGKTIRLVEHSAVA